MRKSVTIQDIANALGLSRNTVSKALNGQYVPAKTREIVLRKARELNYKSFNAGVLTSKKYRILLLSGKPFHNISFFLPLVRGIENHCYDNNYDFFQYVYNPATTSFWVIADHIKSLNIDGIVAIECFDPLFINELLKLGYPTCFIDFPGYQFDPVDKFDLVCTSDQKSVCAYAKEMILKQKVHRLSFVGDFRHCLSFHERYMGMLRALARTGLSHRKEDDILENDESFDYGSVESLKEKIAAIHHLPECFICCNDFVARKVADALKELGYQIPQDTFVVGFDGVTASESGSPAITTFYVNKEALGIEAIRALIHRIEHKDSPTKTIMMDCDLIVRESSHR